MVYLCEITREQQPPDGHLNVHVWTSPDTYRFYVPIPVADIASTDTIKALVIDYCAFNQLEVPTTAEVFVLTRAT